MSLRWARPLAAAAALLLAALAVTQLRAERATRAGDTALWEASGATARVPEAAARASADPDPEASTLMLARVLFADAYDLRQVASLPPAAARAAVAKAGDELRRSDELAAATLRRRPSSW